MAGASQAASVVVEDEWGAAKVTSIVVIIILVLALNVFLLVKGCEGSSSSGNSSAQKSSNWQTENNSEEAYYQMKQFVKTRLASPGSADFPSYFTRGDSHVSKNGTTYTVNSYVDSQNGFGAMLRTNFSGQIKQTDKLTWQLISLELR